VRPESVLDVIEDDLRRRRFKLPDKLRARWLGLVRDAVQDVRDVPKRTERQLIREALARADRNGKRRPEDRA
jgi:hypothetical protein